MISTCLNRVLAGGLLQPTPKHRKTPGRDISNISLASAYPWPAHLNCRVCAQLSASFWVACCWRLAPGLARWLDGLLATWLASWLACWLSLCWLTDLLSARLAGWSDGWRTHWLANKNGNECERNRICRFFRLFFNAFLIISLT